MINHIGGRVRPGASISEAREQVKQRFRDADMDTNGTITPNDIELMKRIQSPTFAPA